MKKLMIGFAACALLITSCSQNEINEESEDKVIGFGTLNDRLVKAANDSSQDYGVYAVRSNATSVWFMNNTEVDGVDNTYSPLQYWPTNATVNFYAYAPYLGGVNINSSTPGSLPLTYTVPANANEDFTITEPIVEASQPSDEATPITFEFSHMLSKMTVAVDLDQDLKDAGYTIEFTSATLSVNKNSGTTDLVTKANLTPTGNAATYTNAKTYMFIPQNSIGTAIQLMGVTIKHNGISYWSGNMKNYVIVSGNLSADKFNANTHYAVKFTVDSDSEDDNDDPRPVFGNAIKFASSIASWDNANVPLVQP